MNSIPVIRQKMLLSIQLWLSLSKIIEHNFKESNINIRTNMLLGQRQQSINGNMDTNKAHFSCDTETSLILKYSFATDKEHDSMHFKDLIDSISQSTYILLDSAYDSEEIYNTIFEKTSAIPIIDTKKGK
jgi:hypothetical protein